MDSHAKRGRSTAIVWLSSTSAAAATLLAASAANADFWSDATKVVAAPFTVPVVIITETIQRPTPENVAKAAASGVLAVKDAVDTTLVRANEEVEKRPGLKDAIQDKQIVIVSAGGGESGPTAAPASTSPQPSSSPSPTVEIALPDVPPISPRRPRRVLRQGRPRCHPGRKPRRATGRIGRRPKARAGSSSERVRRSGNTPAGATGSALPRGDCPGA